jgi:Tfp pilus assembly protein PilF
MRQLMKFLLVKPALIISVVSLLSACVSHPRLVTETPKVELPPVPIVAHAEFGERPDIITPDALFRLEPQQERLFYRYLDEKKSQGIARHQIVTDFLHQYISGFNFYSETLNASEAFKQQKGNCMSLAILTTALAKLAHVDVGYQIMDSTPVYSLEGNTVFTAQHARSFLYDPDFELAEGLIYFMKPMIIVDYFPTNRSNAVVRHMIDENEFISRYYRNKAADAIAQSDYINAFWLARESLELSPHNQHAINMLAIIYDKTRHTDDAENLYRYAINHTDSDIALLSNYKDFLETNHRLSEATEIQKIIDKIDQVNPFDWLKIADTELNKGNLTEALQYYSKVVDLAPYLHHGYAGQAKVEFLRGNPKRARLAFKKAEELSTDEESSQLMRAKMSALTKYEAFED